MASYSFDIVSDYDKAEMNNVLASVQRDITNRYDFKNTPAEIDWFEDKAGFTIIGSNDWQVSSIIDIVRKHLAARGQSSKVLDLSKPLVIANLKTTHNIPFIQGLDQDKAKTITKLLRDELPKVKAAIQGELIRVSSGSKDELQRAMQLVKGHDFDFPVEFTNYR